MRHKVYKDFEVLRTPSRLEAESFLRAAGRWRW